MANSTDTISKENLLNNINEVISQYRMLLGSSVLLASSRLHRKESGVTLFTNKCPFHDNIYYMTGTYPYGSRKYMRKYVERRMYFWIFLQGTLSASSPIITKQYLLDLIALADKEIIKSYDHNCSIHSR